MNTYELYDLADALDVEVDAFSFGAREAMSLQVGEGEYYIALDPFKLEANADEKVKLAHELGHCVTGSFYNQYSTYDLRARHERRADRWAIKQLVPRDELERAVANGQTELYDLADHFGVTEDFMRKAAEYYRREAMK